MENEKPRRWLRWLKWTFFGGVACGVLGGVALACLFVYFSTQVPDFRSLADYKPELITKIYSRDGVLMAEYARERRVYTPIEDVPKPVIQAFLAAEDWNFYNHPGFDIKGIIRAVLVNTFTSRKQGASTITQQVAKTFLLSSERTYTRKIKELILARRIEKAFTKDEILELYLNQIYLGQGAYGITAAALTYYNKRLDELTYGQRAMLAGLPKAPSAYNPLANPQRARWRRDVVLRRMQAEKLISPEEAEASIATDLELNPRALKYSEIAPDFSEHVRRFLLSRYGENRLYTDGMVVHTTLDMELQETAVDAVYRGLRAYDRRHGFRGPIGRVNLMAIWESRIDEEYRKWRHMSQIGSPAVVLSVDDETAQVHIGLPGSRSGIIPLSAMNWARKKLRGEGANADTLGPKITKPSDVLQRGDIIFTQKIGDLPPPLESTDNRKGWNPNQYSLEQIPNVQGALVALDSRTGAIRAMVGGLGGDAGFNRAVQAKRQVGSAFKPFVYAYALEKGEHTPASIILDAPVVLRDGEMGAWKPQNYSQKVYGPSTLRRGLEKSRNLMTIRLARELGIRNIIKYARNLGLEGRMEPDLSTALGSSSLSLLELTSAYQVFANGGHKAPSYGIERVQDMVGSTIFSGLPRCTLCEGEGVLPLYLPVKDVLEGHTQQVMSPVTAYQMVDMLKGVIQRGTGIRARSLGREIGGKTGTTNDFIDAWFMGFSPGLTVGVWVGFDRPQTLGKSEAGSRAALPIWTAFMGEALEGTPPLTFEIPSGVSFVRIDAETGLLPGPATDQTILEVFQPGTEPKMSSRSSHSSGGGVRAEDLKGYGFY